MTVAEATDEGRTILVRFQEVSSRQSAEEIQGFFLAVEEKELKALPSNHFYYFELLGLKVVEKGELRGEVVAIVEGPSYDYLVVRKEEKEYDLPFIRAYVQEVNKEEGFIEVECPEVSGIETSYRCGYPVSSAIEPYLNASILGKAQEKE